MLPRVAAAGSAGALPLAASGAAGGLALLPRRSATGALSAPCCSASENTGSAGDSSSTSPAANMPFFGHGRN